MKNVSFGHLIGQYSSWEAATSNGLPSIVTRCSERELPSGLVTLPVSGPIGVRPDNRRPRFPAAVAAKAAAPDRLDLRCLSERKLSEPARSRASTGDFKAGLGSELHESGSSEASR